MTVGKQIRNGLKAIRRSHIKLFIVMLYCCLLMFLLCLSCKKSVSNPFGLGTVQMTMKYLSICFIWVIAGVFLVIQLGMPTDFVLIRRKFQKIGFCNNISQSPTLIGYENEKSNPSVRVYYFSSKGIPLAEWENNREKIENALNVFIVSITLEGANDVIKLRCVISNGGIPSKVIWDDAIIENIHDFSIVLGLGLTGNIKVNMDVFNSVLVGGSTGSGKTVLLKNVLYQLVMHCSKVYLIDFKGGVDYSNSFWKYNVELVTTKDETVILLDKAIAEMENRKRLFLQYGVANLKEYTLKTGHSMSHITIACDEAAELLDKSGLSKEEKAVTTEIEAKLSTLARLGRAFGIHLVMATQRPDANVISGQIKNNISYRVCGRADNNLSLIVLDNADASKISKETVGRFINQDGEEFQGFWMGDL